MSNGWLTDLEHMSLTDLPTLCFLTPCLLIIVGAMDAFARGLKNACRMQHEAVLSRAKAERYKSFKSGIGAKITAGTTSLEELEVRFRSDI